MTPDPYLKAEELLLKDHSLAREGEPINILFKITAVALLSNFAQTPFVIEHHSETTGQILPMRFQSLESFIQNLLFPSVNSGSPAIECDRHVFMKTLELSPAEYQAFKEGIPALSEYEAKKLERRFKRVHRANQEYFAGDKYFYWNDQRVSFEDQATRLQVIAAAIWSKFDQNPGAREILLATGNRPLAHDTGHFEDPTHSILSQHEFTAILEAIRKDLSKN